MKNRFLPVIMKPSPKRFLFILVSTIYLPLFLPFCLAEETDGYEELLRAEWNNESASARRYISPEEAKEAEEALYEYRRDGKKLKKLKADREKKEMEEAQLKEKYNKPFINSSYALLRIPYTITIDDQEIPSGFYLADLSNNTIIIKQGSRTICSIPAETIEDKANGSTSAVLHYHEDQPTELVVTKGSKKAIVLITNKTIAK